MATRLEEAADAMAKWLERGPSLLRRLVREMVKARHKLDDDADADRKTGD